MKKTTIQTFHVTINAPTRVTTMKYETGSKLGLSFSREATTAVAMARIRVEVVSFMLGLRWCWLIGVRSCVCKIGVLEIVVEVIARRGGRGVDVLVGATLAVGELVEVAVMATLEMISVKSEEASVLLVVTALVDALSRVWCRRCRRCRRAGQRRDRCRP
jgi:hypothetical protein